MRPMKGSLPADIRLVGESERHYEIVGPAGHFLFENCGRFDECVWVDGIGTVNVKRAWSLVPTGAEPEKFALDQRIAEHIARRDLDPDTLARMTPKRRNEPVLFVVHEGRLQLIDGTHRLHARLKHGLRSARGFVLRSEAVEHCRVRSYKIEGGIRIPFDAAPP